MEAFVSLTSVAAPLALEGVETDQIIAARDCVRPAGADYADALFGAWRRDSGFVLDRDAFRSTRILVAGANFGYGSSREHAAWALRDFGIRAVVASSFGGIFRSNCVRSGILPAAVPASALATIFAEIDPGPAELTIELEPQSIVAPSGREHRFEIAPLDKRLLLDGIDATTLVLRVEDEIASFQAAHRRRSPWIYEPLEARWTT
jgi:3-isopropylmalate/(R)-2-methylmalate dehydratase small subunit